jgi:hypothetical protein
VQRHAVLKSDPLPAYLGGFEIYFLDLEKREVFFAFPGKPDLSANGIARL